MLAESTLFNKLYMYLISQNPMAIARGKEVWEGRYFIMDTYDSQCHEVLLVRKNEKMDIKQTTRRVSPSGSKRPNDLGISTDD